jgi:hypothetical protein
MLCSVSVYLGVLGLFLATILDNTKVGEHIVYISLIWFSAMFCYVFFPITLSLLGVLQ